MEKLSSPVKIRYIMDKYGFRFSKSLGQNFLIDANIVDKIVEGAGVTEEDVILEVGPGIGVMTESMAEVAEKVVAVEIDDSLMPVLEETLGHFDNVKVINNDILKVDIKALIKEEFGDKKPKVVANLPYYVTTPIVMRFLEEEIPVSDIVVMIQKEVADRMNAEPNNKNYGALSVAVQYYSETEIVTKVPRSVFMPQPNVDSTVIRLKLRDEPAVQVIDKAIFFMTVRASFGKRRKTLLNALSSSDLGIDKGDIKDLLIASDIEPSRRGETLSIDEFATLSNTIATFLNKR